MGKYDVLSDGEKIKSIRKKYGLRQDEISGNDITRNLISEIETNKANITRKTAEIIIKNLNAVADKKRIKVVETIEYLMENEIVQASKILEECIYELRTLIIAKDDSFIKILKETENFLINWNIKDKKIVIYELAGDYFYNHNDYYKSCVYYEKALELTGKLELSQNLLNLLRKVSMLYIYIGKYDESIDNCEFALKNFSEMKNDYKATFIYNSSIGYQKLGNLKKALQRLNEVKNFISINDEKYVQVLNNQAACLEELEEFQEALKMYNEILKLLDKDDIEYKMIISVNVLNVYIKLNMDDILNEKLKNVIEQLYSLNNSSRYIAHINFEIGKAYKYLNNLSMAEVYYMKSLDFAKKQKRYVLANEILCDLIDVYVCLNDVKKMDSLKKEVFQLSNRQERLSNSLMYKLFDFYSNDNITVKELSKFALQFK